MSAELSPSEFTLPRRRQFDQKSPGRWVLSHAVRYWPTILVMVIGAFGNAALGAVVPIVIGQAFDAVLDPSTFSIGTTLFVLAVWIALSQLLRALLQFGRNFGAELLAQRLERDIRDELYVSLLGKSMTFHSLQPVGDTMARATNDVREVNLMFSPGLNLVVGSAMFLVMPVVLATRYHPTLAIIPFLFVVSYFLSLWQYLKELDPITSNARDAFGEMNARLAEALDGIETVKGTAQEANEIALFKENTLRVRNALVQQGYVEARFLPQLLLALTSAGGFLHAALLMSQGVIGFGDVVAYFTLIQMFGFPTFASLFAYSQVSLGLAGAKRILSLINEETRLDQNAEGYAGPMRGQVEFSDVSFQYNSSSKQDSSSDPVPDGDNTLENINFCIRPGQTVAIVGQTGSGKTSLVKLINRIYDATAGNVMIDGVDVRDWNLAALRQNISIIEQDIFLFSRTIAENIAFGRPGASQAEIEQAAASAQANEFILSFKDGYQTVIGERGVTLSGGQRQRLALARAFLTNPRILILDDSTSSIDSATEDRIQQAIFAAARGRTTFLITHRISQIRWADLIIVLRQGKVAAIGTHDDLLRTSQAYRQIFSE